MEDWSSQKWDCRFFINNKLFDFPGALHMHPVGLFLSLLNQFKSDLTWLTAARRPPGSGSVFICHVHRDCHFPFRSCSFSQWSGGHPRLVLVLGDPASDTLLSSFLIEKVEFLPNSSAFYKHIILSPHIKYVGGVFNCGNTHHLVVNHVRLIKQDNSHFLCVSAFTSV